MDELEHNAEFSAPDITPRMPLAPVGSEGVELDFDDEVLDFPRLGEVSLHDLPHLLNHCLREGFTGRLILEREGAKKEITFEEGHAVFAQSNQVHDRLGELLHREGKITWDQYVQSLRLVKENKLRMGMVLVEKGYVKAHELFPLVKRHIAEIIYSLFSWSSGEYQLIAEDTTANEKIQLDSHPTAIILEGIRRKFSLDRLYQLIGPPTSKLVLHPAGFQRLQRAQLSESEKRTLELFDGTRSLAEVREAAAEEDLKVYQIAYAAMVLRALYRYGAPESQRHLCGEDTQHDPEIEKPRINSKFSQSIEGSYFALLGLPPEATPQEIERAYEQMRADFTPDNFAPAVREEMKAQLSEIGEAIEEAWQVLRRQSLREAYRNSVR